MGDFRASIKIEVDFWGEKDSVDMWINYNGEFGEVDGVDDRLIDFFRNAYNKSMIKYNVKNEKLDKDNEKKRDTEEYKRLKKKLNL